MSWIDGRSSVRALVACAGVALLALTALASDVGAQEPKPGPPVEPDSAKYEELGEMEEMDVAAAMEEMLGATVPMYREMAAVMIEATLEVMARPESAELMATFTRNYFEALVEKGFTREEALHIVAAARLPSLQGR